MANGAVDTRNGKVGWILGIIVPILQVIILAVVGLLFTDLREVRDSSIKFGGVQERLVRDVQNVEYNVRALNNTVQQLVGQGKNSK